MRQPAINTALSLPSPRLASARTPRHQGAESGFGFNKRGSAVLDVLATLKKVCPSFQLAEMITLTYTL